MRPRLRRAGLPITRIPVSGRITCGHPLKQTQGDRTSARLGRRELSRARIRKVSVSSALAEDQRDKMNVLDLFSGIGGFSLGLERAGMRTVAFCEIDPFCRRVLARHWPDVPCYEDIRTVTTGNGIVADVICGGFPCQDVSRAGAVHKQRLGLRGPDSGLWAEFARIIGDFRPRYAIVENGSDLLNLGLGDVLGDLAALGYDAEWHCIRAAAVGLPHRRDRTWIVAYPNRERLAGQHGQGQSAGNGGRSCDAQSRPILTSIRSKDWIPEPDVCRVADGFPNRVDRLRSLGNAVVPQIPEIIGRAIMKTNQRRGC
jgi:DNA (cytosine-5)-methyltransferase 1